MEKDNNIYSQLKLEDVIDPNRLQKMMEDYYNLIRIPMAIIDNEGKTLVGVGWQDVCTKFHRVNPQTCKHCVESDTQLTAGFKKGEFKVYRCKNGLWDAATPLVIGDKKLGNLFIGQFFFEGEKVDYELFRSMAKLYGFNEKEYIAAVDSVPRISKEKIENSMEFLLKLATMISDLSYGNIRLTRLLAERDNLLELLRKTTKDLKRAQAVAHSGSWHLDTGNNKLSWSDETYRIFGIPPDSELTYEKFLSLVHPDDRKLVDDNWAAALKGASYDVEHRIIVEGKTRWMHEIGELEFDNKNRLIGGFGSVQDITERKEFERKLEKLASFPQLNPQPVIELDFSGNLVFVNPGAKKIFPDLEEQGLNHLFLSDFRILADSFDKENVNFITREINVRHQWFLQNWYYIRDIKCIRIYAVDITEIKRVQEELKRSNESLEQFAYVASHDLQEPLRVMFSYSQLLEKRYRGQLDTDAHDFIGFIVEAANRMQKMIIDLLNYSRVGRIEKAVSSVNFNETLHKVIYGLASVLDADKARITHDELPVIAVSETRLMQLFQNLISNALKFRSKKTPEIHIGAVKKGDEWVFSVKDNGIGIEPQYHERVFQIFQRLHSKEEYSGTGIGLSICRKIVLNWGGRIWVDSELGKGSTFYFTIPVKEVKNV